MAPVVLWSFKAEEGSRTKLVCAAGGLEKFKNPQQKVYSGHRIIEAFRLEKTFQITSPAVNLTLPNPRVNDIPKNHIT